MKVQRHHERRYYHHKGDWSLTLQKTYRSWGSLAASTPRRRIYLTLWKEHATAPLSKPYNFTVRQRLNEWLHRFVRPVILILPGQRKAQWSEGFEAA